MEYCKKDLRVLPYTAQRANVYGAMDLYKCTMYTTRILRVGFLLPTHLLRTQNLSDALTNTYNEHRICTRCSYDFVCLYNF